MVVTHKKCDIPTFSPYRPVIVGKGDFELEHALRDNEGENIAEKNPYYCELTALYWVWKNQVENYDNIGLCHYRRMFTRRGFSNETKYLLTDKEIEKNLCRYDAILPRPFVWPVCVEQMYLMGAGKQKDLDLTREAVEELFPEYSPALESVLRGKQGSYCNMFVLPQKHFNDYCQWLFQILQYVEDRCDMTGYTVQEQRVFGYLSEILLNVWVRYNKLKVKYYPIAYLELSLQEHKKKFFADFVNGLRIRVHNLIKG